MVNYVNEIERELLALRERMQRYEIALDVVRELRAREIPLTEAVAEEMQSRKALMAPQKKKSKRVVHPTGGLMRMRAGMLELLESTDRPMKSREMIDILIPRVQAAESTFWSAARELKLEGRIRWDDITRLYSIVKKEAA